LELCGAVPADQPLDAAFGDAVLLGELPLRRAVLERGYEQPYVRIIQAVDNPPLTVTLGG